MKQMNKKEEKILRILMDDYHLYSFPNMTDIKNQSDINSPGIDFKKFYEELLVAHHKIYFYLEKK